MKVSYGVVWRESESTEVTGRLEIGADALLLHPAGAGDRAPEPFALDELDGVEIRPPDERPTLVLHGQAGREIVLESAVDRWILGDLLTRLFARTLSGRAGRQRILVAMALKPGCRQRARELLRAGPPFDPRSTALTLHEAFLLGDEVLFLFATGPGQGVEALVEPEFWRALAAWRELTAGGVRLAEPAFEWRRDVEPLAPMMHLGLGL